MYINKWNYKSLEIFLIFEYFTCINATNFFSSKLEKKRGAECTKEKYLKFIKTQGANEEEEKKCLYKYKLL